MAPQDRTGRTDAPFDISEEEFRRFGEFFYRRTGMVFGESKRYYVSRRLIERIQATGSASFQEYFAFLRIDPREQEALVNAFTINETYFFREEHQLRCLTATLLGQVTANRRRTDPIRIWSVPCATGEEPYSIAIWLLENWPEVDNWDIEILGADIDTRALGEAGEGIYSSRALMRLPRPLVERYFERIDEGRWRISAALRGSVSFGQVNVVDRQDMARYRGVDIVFCRNMLIYFDEASRREAAENLYDCLVPGGWVCLGHTESMSRISSLFQVCRFEDAIVYRKPKEAPHG